MFSMKTLFNHGRRDGFQQWVHAEAFLAAVENAFLAPTAPKDKLDLARRKSHLLALAKDAWGGPVSADFERRGNLVLRRVLAAECSRFCTAPYTEIWDPYKTWIATLDPALDTLISFNYDCVVEIADVLRLEDPETPAADRHRSVYVPMPWAADAVFLDDGERPLVKLLKMHGSANWNVERPSEGEKLSGLTGNPDLGGARGFLAGLVDPSATLGIAAPGGAKRLFVDGQLEKVWHAAKQRIRRANAVVFLGYGLPGTDEVAKNQLLEEIGRDSTGDVHIHVVLGSDINRAAVRRLTALLATIGPATSRRSLIDGLGAGDPTNGNLRIWRHAMGAEDFIPRADLHARAKELGERAF
jgi:hypothetical protein